MGIEALPSAAQAEHVIISAATIIGASEIVVLALAALTLLLLKVSRLVIEEYYEVAKVAREKKLSLPPSRDPASASLRGAP